MSIYPPVIACEIHMRTGQMLLLNTKEYINKVKLRYAENLLQNSNNSIIEIAASVGFDDVLSFSRFFSKKKGISPSNYR